jgi:TATA-box binding protein (TBP) (component of TFIID and TFIIIB)
MGLFNEFENSNSNSNSNTPLTSQNMIRRAPYLTNQERGALMKNAMQLPINKVSSRIGAITGDKFRSTNFTQLKISPLQLSIFNGMVNQDAKNGNYSVDVNPILYKKPHKRKPISPGSTLGVEVNSIILRYGRMAIGAKHTFTVKPNANNVKKHAHFLAEINGRIFENGLESKFMVKVYKNGKMQVSGGILNNNIRHPEMIRKYIVDTYIPNAKFLYNPIKYVVLVGTFQTNGVLKLAGIASAFSRSRNASYEPELRPSLKMVHKNQGFQLFRSGKIQIMGAKTTRDLNNAYNIGVDLVKELNVMGLISNFKNINIKPTAKKVRVVKNKQINTTDNAISYFDKSNSKNGKNGIRVGKKKCATVPRPKLVAAAEKIGIVDITGKTTKPQICAKIKDKVYGKFTVKNRPCKAYTKEELIPIAITKGVPISDFDTVDTICKKLNIPKPLPTNVKKVEKAAKAANKKVRAQGKVLETRGLTNAGIKKDIQKLYGKKWLNTYKNVMPSLNSDVAELKKRINTANVKKNKAGVPFKMGVNAIKRQTVSEWKMQRRKKLNNKLNALNNNFAKNLENIMNKNKTPSPPKKTTFPKGTKVEQL